MKATTSSSGTDSGDGELHAALRPPTKAPAAHACKPPQAIAPSPKDPPSTKEPTRAATPAGAPVPVSDLTDSQAPFSMHETDADVKKLPDPSDPSAAVDTEMVTDDLVATRAPSAHESTPPAAATAAAAAAAAPKPHRRRGQSRSPDELPIDTPAVLIPVPRNGSQLPQTQQQKSAASAVDLSVSHLPTEVAPAPEPDAADAAAAVNTAAAAATTAATAAEAPTPADASADAAVVPSTTSDPAAAAAAAAVPDVPEREALNSTPTPGVEAPATADTAAATPTAALLQPQPQRNGQSPQANATRRTPVATKPGHVFPSKAPRSSSAPAASSSPPPLQLKNGTSTPTPSNSRMHGLQNSILPEFAQLDCNSLQTTNNNGNNNNNTFATDSPNFPPLAPTLDVAAVLDVANHTEATLAPATAASLLGLPASETQDPPPESFMQASASMHGLHAQSIHPQPVLSPSQPLRSLSTGRHVRPSLLFAGNAGANINRNSVRPASSPQTDPAPLPPPTSLDLAGRESVAEQSSASAIPVATVANQTTPNLPLAPFFANERPCASASAGMQDSGAVVGAAAGGAVVNHDGGLPAWFTLPAGLTSAHPAATNSGPQDVAQQRGDSSHQLRGARGVGVVPDDEEAQSPPRDSAAADSPSDTVTASPPLPKGARAAPPAVRATAAQADATSKGAAKSQSRKHSATGTASTDGAVQPLRRLTDRSICKRHRVLFAANGNALKEGQRVGYVENRKHIILQGTVKLAGNPAEHNGNGGILCSHCNMVRFPSTMKCSDGQYLWC